MKSLGNYHLSTAIVVMMLGVFTVLLGGCSSKEETKPPKPKPTAKSTQVAAAPTKAPTVKVDAPSNLVKKEEPAKTVPAKALPADLGNKIAGAKDFFTWYDLREIYTKAGITDAKVEEALKAKETELLKANPPKSMTKGLELVAFEWKREAEVKPTEMVKHHLAILFRATGKPSLTPEQKIAFLWRAIPKPEHIEVLVRNGFKNPYQKDQPPLCIEEWPPMSSAPELWQAGTYIFFQRDVDAPRLPYKIEMQYAKYLKSGKYLGTYAIFMTGLME